ncbi:MAG: recombinase family protein [Syntrophomonadaceae bacterium]|jgi:DNA invertase Pin-like site-specific DNA recombinase|nr:recombinase family protein [Syntrophomonadaceae bacterium]
MANQEKYTILYSRLSQEDEREGESNSIQNQRLMLEKYAEDNGFQNLKFLYDDGYSGTNFNRPAWKEVMGLVESDQVSTLIVKDMSRLGRDYLLVGQYTEMIFPSYGIRFIAVNDGVDSLYGDNDFAPFKNLFNDFYSKDTSRKIRAVKKAQAERGERIATRPPYGYKKSEDNPRRIVPDEQSAEVIRHIFRLCAEGRGPSQIAKQLKTEQVLTPTNYYYRKTGVALVNLDTERPYNWSSTTIANILSDVSYLGHTVNMRYTTVSYKNKKQIERPESEWLKFESTHEPLISQELWDIVQDIRKHKKRPPKQMNTPNLFSGLVFCADCNGTLVLHRAHTMKETQNNFMCSTYKKRGKEECSAHYIRETQLKAIILDDLKRVTHYARQKEKLFAEHITRKNSAETRLEITRIQREIDAAKRRDSELTALFKRLYEDNVLGRIPNEHFRLLSAEYTTEQAELRNKLPKLEERLEQLRNSLTNVAQFIDKAKRYSHITELTPEILRLFIEKIVVGEKAQKYSRTAEQDIWIYYRDIGLMDTPVTQPEALEAELGEGEDILTDETLTATSAATAASTDPAA